MNPIKKIYCHIQRWVYRHDEEVERQYRYNDCVAKFRERLEKNNIPVDQPAPGEEEYIRFWQQFDKRVEPYTYRFFSRIVGPNPSIVPEDVADAYIERLLNPIRYRDFYGDKNLYSLYLSPKQALPHTLLCRMGGLLLNENHEPMLRIVTGGGVINNPSPQFRQLSLLIA